MSEGSMRRGEGGQESGDQPGALNTTFTKETAPVAQWVMIFFFDLKFIYALSMGPPSLPHACTAPLTLSSN